MNESQADISAALVLDGNAVAGLLHEIMGRDMTTVPAECANCGNRAEMAALLAFTQGPGVVLRCAVCKSVVLRVAVTEKWVYLDARGAAFLRIERPSVTTT